jgi:hypothetical protein
MIYLSKLAKRLALAGPHSRLLLLVSLAGACSTPEEKEFLSPNPSQTIPITSLAVEPKIGTAKPGEVIQFNATVKNAKGAVVVADVDWSATGGEITGAGTFVSDVYGHFQVTARLRSNSLVADSAKVGVFVNPTDIMKLSLTPDGTEVTEGEGVQLEATAELADGSVVVQPALAWSADVGQVDGSGYFIAPEIEGTYLVKAQAASGVAGETNVVVRPNKRNLERVEVGPGTVSLTPGQTQQFTSVGVWEDGYTKAVPVAWSSTGGTISGDGLFTAGSTPGNYRVIGRYKQGTQADTSFISITEPEIVALDVTPNGTSLEVGATQQYVATARLSDGSAKEVGASWSATGGNITPTGLYSATADGAFKVRAAVAGTTLETETSVNVTAAAPTLTRVTLSPSSATIPTGTARQFTVTGTYSDGTTRTPSATWSATGGSITTSGNYTAGTVLGNFRVIVSSGGKADTSAITISSADLTSLSISPSTASLAPGATQQFTASGTWSNGSTLAPVVTWSATGGSITSGGVYTAGTASGTYRVIGTHAAGRADTSLVTITPPAPVLVSVTLSPASVSLSPAATRQFSVTGTWTGGGTGAPSVTYTATGGTITAGGLYTAGTTTGTFRVIAKHTGGTVADTSSVTISSTAATLSSITVSPASTSLQTGGTRQFSVAAVWSDGSTAAPGVTWTTNGGTVSASGLYTAPTTTGTYRVIVKVSAGTKADTANVTVSAPATVTALTVTPGSKSLPTGSTQQYTASATYSNGGTGTPSLSWTATGGTITSGGLYTASGSVGNYRVIATASGTNVKDTAQVTLTSTTPTVTGLVLNPGSVTLAPGTTSQFSTNLSWSDGATRTATITYSATGGTISSSGLYSAGTTSGIYRVIANCSGCTVADTAVIIIGSQSGGSSGHANQPSGYVGISNEPFANFTVITSGGRYYRKFPQWVEDGTWSTTSGDPDLGVHTSGEGGSGTLDGSAASIRVPQGWYTATGSAFPGMWRVDLPGQRSSIYAHFRFKLSSNYIHWNGSKFGYFYAGTKSPIFIALVPEGSFTTQTAAINRPVRIRLGLQGVIAPASGHEAGWESWNAERNLGTASQAHITRGVWHDIEIQLIGNSAGRADGVVRMWLNGVKIIEYNQAGFFGGTNSSAAYWSMFTWAPTHDDFNNVPYEFSVYQYVDNAYFATP